MEATLHRGRLLHAPTFQGTSSPVEFFEDGCLLVRGGRIEAVGAFSELKKRHEGVRVEDHGRAFLVPGFVDLHLHFPQLDIIGRTSGTLLSWLEKYTFPAEIKYQDVAYAREAARAFVTELMRHGVTTAVMFSSVHAGATDVLFETCEQAGMRAVIGKVSMDQNAPADLLQDWQSDLEDTRRLAKKWHGVKGRLFYALTPRFVPSCSEPLLRGLGEIKAAQPDLFVQSHHSENVDEIAWVKQLHPKAPHYLGVYEEFGLLGPRTIMAHGIHVTEAECERYLTTGTHIAHCPTSNLFLGSGLFATKRLLDRGLSVGLGTDIGAGTTFSMWQTMNEAGKVARLAGAPVSPATLLGLATTAGAACLGLASETGSFRAGLSADFQVIDTSRSALLSRWDAQGLSCEDWVASLIHFADPHLLKALFIEGKAVMKEGRPVQLVK